MADMREAFFVRQVLLSAKNEKRDCLARATSPWDGGSDLHQYRRPKSGGAATGARVIALDVSPDMPRKQLTIIGSWTFS